jgi:hypothetical protein
MRRVRAGRPHRWRRGRARRAKRGLRRCVRMVWMLLALGCVCHRACSGRRAASNTHRQNWGAPRRGGGRGGRVLGACRGVAGAGAGRQEGFGRARRPWVGASGLRVLRRAGRARGPGGGRGRDWGARCAGGAARGESVLSTAGGTGPHKWSFISAGLKGRLWKRRGRGLAAGGRDRAKGVAAVAEKGGAGRRRVKSQWRRRSGDNAHGGRRSRPGGPRAGARPAALQRATARRAACVRGPGLWRVFRSARDGPRPAGLERGDQLGWGGGVGRGEGCLQVRTSAGGGRGCCLPGRATKFGEGPWVGRQPRVRAADVCGCGCGDTAGGREASLGAMWPGWA